MFTYKHAADAPFVLNMRHYSVKLKVFNFFLSLKTIRMGINLLMRADVLYPLAATAAVAKKRMRCDRRIKRKCLSLCVYILFIFYYYICAYNCLSHILLRTYSERISSHLYGEGIIWRPLSGNAHKEQDAVACARVKRLRIR